MTKKTKEQVIDSQSKKKDGEQNKTEQQFEIQEKEKEFFVVIKNKILLEKIKYQKILFDEKPFNKEDILFFQMKNQDRLLIDNSSQEQTKQDETKQTIDKLKINAKDYQELKNQLFKENKNFICKISFQVVTDFTQQQEEQIIFILDSIDVKNKKIDKHLCFIDLNKSEMSKIKIKKIKIDFQQKYEDIFEKKVYNKHRKQSQIFNNMINSSLLCRVSEWERLTSNILIAKFIIGCNLIHGGIHTIEIREYYVQLPQNQESNLFSVEYQDSQNQIAAEEIKERENNQFKMNQSAYLKDILQNDKNKSQKIDQFKKKQQMAQNNEQEKEKLKEILKQEFNQNKIEYLKTYFGNEENKIYLTQIKYLIFKQQYSKGFRSFNRISDKYCDNPIQYHRFLPKFDEEGKISGSYAFINHVQSEIGIHQQNDQTIFQRLNRDGLTFVKKNYNGHDIEGKIELSTLKDQNINEFRKYDIIDISENSSQTISYINRMKNSIFECNILENQYAFLTSSKYTDEFIENINIEQIYQIYFLYSLSKKMFTLKMNDYFTNLFEKNEDEDINFILQPQMSFKGQNQLLILLDQFLKWAKEQKNSELDQSKTQDADNQQKTKILSKLNELFDVLNQEPKIQNHVKNSILNNFINYDINIDDLVKFYGFNPEFDFECDILNKYTLLELLFNDDCVPEFKKTVTFLIENRNNNKIFRFIIQRNLLLLLSQDNVKIYSIFNMDAQIEKLLGGSLDQDNFSNIEQILKQTEFQDYLQEEGLKENQQWRYKNQGELYLSNYDILNRIKFENESKDMIDRISSNQQQLVKIVHSYIDFTHSFRQLTFQILLRKFENEEDSQMDTIMLKLENAENKLDSQSDKDKDGPKKEKNYFKNSQKQYIKNYDKLYLGNKSQTKKCTDLMLARMMTLKKQDTTFYDQQTVQEIIELQYKDTQDWILALLLIYLIGFFIPYTYNVLSYNLIDVENQAQMKVRETFNYFQIITQVLFFILTIYQSSTLQNIKDIDKFIINGYFQAILFTAYYFLQQYQVKSQFGGLRIAVSVIIIILNISSFMKIVEHITFTQQFQFFVAVFSEVIVELVPFIVLFVGFAFFFAFIIIILKGGVQDFENYTDVPMVIQAFFQAFRTQIGDIQINQYGIWDEDAKKQNPGPYYIAVTILWIFWFFNIVIMQIMMLNIVIAQVGQIFDRVMSRGEGKVHQELAILNYKIFQIIQIFEILKTDENHFDALIIQRPLRNATDAENDKSFSTLTGRIKKNVQLLLSKQYQNLKDDIKSETETLQKSMESQIVIMKSDIELKMKTEMGNLKTEIGAVQTQLKNSIEQDSKIKSQLDQIQALIVSLQPKQEIKEEAKEVQSEEKQDEKLQNQ